MMKAESVEAPKEKELAQPAQATMMRAMVPEKQPEPQPASFRETLKAQLESLRALFSR
jgi:flagellar hook-basal body complex protein FliE